MKLGIAVGDGETGKQVFIFPELCNGCGSCSCQCPDDAIHETLNVGEAERAWNRDV